MEQLLLRVEERTLMLLLAATVLCIAAALVSYVVWPGYERYRDTRSELLVLSRVVDSGDTLDHKIDEMRHKVDFLERQIHGDMTNLSDTQLEAVVIGRMQSISWRDDIELRSIKPVAGNNVQAYKEVSFQVEIEGDYFAIYNWVKDITHELGFIVIKRFDLQPLQRNSATPRLRGSLTLVTYQESDNA